jgi:hypothetical protein
MNIANTGQADVDIKLTTALTEIRFLAVGLGDITSQYSITQPTGLDIGGGTLLAGNNTTNSLTFIVTQTGTTTGPVLINGRVGGEDQNSFEDVTDDTFDGVGSGSIEVQSPGLLEITGITTSQPTVTVGQTQPSWTAEMHVRNMGESDIEVTDNPDSTLISFDLGAGWNWNPPTITLSSIQGAPMGPVTLGENESTTIFFNVTQTGDTRGPATIHGRVRGRQLNDNEAVSDTTDTSGSGSITVQDPASLSITQVATSVSQVTKNRTTDWRIDVTVTNSGEADALLSTGQNETFVAFATATPPDTVTQPSGDLSLPGDSVTVLTFNVATTPDFAGFGNEPFNVRIGGVEVNRNLGMSTTSVDSILVQLSPDPTYAGGSLTPTVVSRGSVVGFQVEVDEIVGSSVIVLDPGETRFILDDGFAHEVRPRLSDLSADLIQAGGNTLLIFDNVLIDNAFVNGSYPATIRLEGTENGTFFTKDITTGSDEVTITDPGAVSIEQIVVSQDRVTTSQTRDWQARMVVHSNSAVPVVVNPAATGLTFDVFDIGDKTSEYTVIEDFNFRVSGNDTLLPSATDTLLFVIDVTGSTPGQLTVNGAFEGREIPSMNIVQANTFGGGPGVAVETPAVLEIVNIRPSQPTVTESQTGWDVIMTVQNTGGSIVDLQLGTSQLNFAPVPGQWGFLWPTELDGNGGTELGAGEIDSLFFNITDIAGAGLYQIAGSLDAIELNSGRTLSDDTGSSGPGSVLVQTPAVLAIQQITKSQEPVTSGQMTPWTVDVEVKNNGEADATLSLIRDDSYLFFATTSDTVAPPTGDALVPGDSTRAFTFTIAPTPSFAAAASEPFDVRLGGTEDNTTNPLSVTGSDNVDVELPPNPTYVTMSLDPRSVSRGGNAVFRAEVEQGPGLATVVLDPITTQFVISDGVTIARARLDGVSPNTIDAGSSTVLVFERVQIDTSFVAGNYLPTLELRGIENGDSFSLDLQTVPDSVGVQEPQAVDIEQIRVSTDTVTAGQTKDWTAKMIVRNNGDAQERVDTLVTDLSFWISSTDFTPEYKVNSDYTFLKSGNQFINAQDTDTLLFTVSVTGTTTGLLTVHGVFKGDAVQDDTFSGGAASMQVD